MTERHPNSQRFHELLVLAGDTHDTKQADYGKGDDPFHNVRSASEFGLPGSLGCFIRMNDKMVRLKSFARNGSLSNEGVLDTLMDLAVYSLIAYVLFEEEEAKGITAEELPRFLREHNPAPEDALPISE